MTMSTVLTVNAGSSSVKLRLIGNDNSVLRSADVAFDPTAGSVTKIVDSLRSFGTADIVAHRVVHGGVDFRHATLIDADVVGALRRLTPLAPLHQHSALQLIAAVGAERPATPSVGCFDTSFHSTMPAAAATYAVPASWRTRFGARRYGFHGLSHDQASRRACEIAGRQLDATRVVVCHLGAGASVCAVLNGGSVDTSMGFTPLDGLVMATRSGAVDPGLVLWLIEHAGLTPNAVRHALEHESGLLALAGTADMRLITEGVSAGDAGCVAALDVYVHRLRSEIGSMAAAMNGIDVLAFTGGVGEHSPEVRRRTCLGLAHLGVTVDDAANDRSTGDSTISADDGGAACVVVTAREDLSMARAARACLSR